MDKDDITPSLAWVAQVLAHIDLHCAHEKLINEIGSRQSPEPFTTAKQIEHLTGIGEVHLRILSASGFVPRFRFGERICYSLEALSFLLKNLRELKQDDEA